MKKKHHSDTALAISIRVQVSFDMAQAAAGC